MVQTPSAENPNQPRQSADDREQLIEFIKEAEFVRALADTSGWKIIERDLRLSREEIASRLGYLSPKRPEFDEARVRFLASDMLIKMVEDYEENRKKTMELLSRLENTGNEIALDYDTR